VVVGGGGDDDGGRGGVGARAFCHSLFYSGCLSIHSGSARQTAPASNPSLLRRSDFFALAEIRKNKEFPHRTMRRPCDLRERSVKSLIGESRVPGRVPRPGRAVNHMRKHV